MQLGRTESFSVEGGLDLGSASVGIHLELLHEGHKDFGPL